MKKSKDCDLILSLSLHIVPGCPAVSFVYRCFACGLQKHTPISEKVQKEHFFSNDTGKDLECAILKESVTVPINVVVTHTKKIS